MCVCVEHDLRSDCVKAPALLYVYICEDILISTELFLDERAAETGVVVAPYVWTWQNLTASKNKKTPTK